MIPGGVLLAAFALGQVPTPMTVNDIELRPREDFVFRGPGRVCMVQTAFDLSTGETAYVDYLGIHIGRLRIIGTQGQLDLEERELFLDADARGQVMTLSADRTIIRYGRGARSDVLLISGSDWARQRPRAVLRIRGSALRGTPRDYNILARISYLDENYSSCARRFDYGWNFLFGWGDWSNDDEQEQDPHPSQQPQQ